MCFVRMISENKIFPYANPVSYLTIECLSFDVSLKFAINKLCEKVSMNDMIILTVFFSIKTPFKDFLLYKLHYCTHIV